MDKPPRNRFYCPKNPKLRMLLLCCLYHIASSASFGEGGVLVEGVEHCPAPGEQTHPVLQHPKNEAVREKNSFPEE